MSRHQLLSMLGIVSVMGLFSACDMMGGFMSLIPSEALGRPRLRCHRLRFPAPSGTLQTPRRLSMR